MPIVIAWTEITGAEPVEGKTEWRDANEGPYTRKINAAQRELMAALAGK